MSTYKVVQAVIELPSGRFARIDEDGEREGVSPHNYSRWDGVIAHSVDDMRAMQAASDALFGADA